MNKNQSLKSTRRFNEVIKSGRKIRSEYLFISYLPAKDLKIGISVPKKLCGAVLRNKYKRQIKNFISKNDFTELKKHITIIVRDKWIKENISFEEKRIIFNEQMNKIK